MTEDLVVARSHDRATRVAGVAGAGVMGLLTLWLVVLLLADDSWLSAYYFPPKILAEVTRVVVGVPVCVLGVLLLADRGSTRLGAVVLAAGSFWLVPSALTDSAPRGAVTHIGGAMTPK